MQDPALSKYTAPFGLSLAICAVLNALLVIAKEKSKSVTDWMQKVTGHHWITHVVIVLIAFFALGFAFAQSIRPEGTKISANRLTNIVITGVVVSILIIGGFYLIAD
jgi:heme/copper-type cytochrome/quinol oxidase subunit 2